MGRVVEVVSGRILPLALLFAGGWFLVLLLPHIRFRRQRRERGRRRGGAAALAVALAGTLGVGNIAGVASAIALGGAGAIFWLWVSAVFAMALKYAEVVLAVRTRRFDENGAPYGGAPYYMERALGKRVGRAVGALFSVLCFLCSLTLGGVMQSAAAAEAISGAFALPSLAVGVAIGLAATAVLWVGAKGVERACTLLIPLVCLLFSVASLGAIFVGRAALSAAFSAIFTGAFTWQSGTAGVGAFLGSRALRYGVARGLVSNEAGCGTAPIAHAAANTDSPVRQGLFGVVEVFVDTVLLCTMTALVILVSGVSPTAGGGMTFAMAAYRALLGEIAVPILSVFVLLFAFATVLCWAHYGTESLCMLTGKRKQPRWLLLAVLASCTWGGVAAPHLVWDLTDLVLSVMAILNVTVLLFLRREVVDETSSLQISTNMIE